MNCLAPKTQAHLVSIVVSLPVLFQSDTGAIIQIATNETALNVSQAWGYYTSFDKNIDATKESSADTIQVCTREQFYVSNLWFR